MRCRLVLLLPLVLAGCAGSVMDPFARPGTWRPAGVNQANLRAMLAEPGDLLRGQAAQGQDGHGAAAAIDRLRRDRVKPLPDSTLARVGATGSGAAATGATP